MTRSAATEQLVEDVAAADFGAIGAAIKSRDAAQVMLKARLDATLHRLNPHLPQDTLDKVVRNLSRPPHPTLIQTTAGSPRCSPMASAVGSASALL